MAAATYTLKNFATSLKLDDCRIQNVPDLIFLCGGPMGQDGPFKSGRHYFHRQLKTKKAYLARRVKLAEEINDWFKKAWFKNDTAFFDLVEVENHLAHIASVTVLFVESPGSIAELGAFAASDVLRHKLLVVMNEFHGTEDSFIADGPIRKLTNHDAARVLYDSWNPDETDSRETRLAFARIAKGIISFVESLDTARPKQVEFRKKETEHTLLFVADLIWFQGAVSRSEIVEVLDAVGCDASLDNVRRHLSILQSVGFIGKRKRGGGDETFYVPLLVEPFLAYAYANDTALKEIVKIKQAIRDSLEPRRKSIVTSMLKAASNG